MQGKNILITGASQGIGRGVAEYLISLGANIIAVARNEEKLQELREIAPSQVYIYPYDLSNVDDIEKIFIFCKNQNLKLDGLVYCAGVSITNPIKSLDVMELQSMYVVNTLAYIQMTKFFILKKYSNDSSSIIGISSAASKLCEKGMANYCTSKAAMNTYTSVLAKEVVKRRIRANTIAPAMVETDMYWGTLATIEGYEEYSKEQQPFGVIPVEQVAYLVRFLLSEESLYITGACIPVSAGNNFPI